MVRKRKYNICIVLRLRTSYLSYTMQLHIPDNQLELSVRAYFVGTASFNIRWKIPLTLYKLLILYILKSTTAILRNTSPIKIFFIN